MFPTCDSGIAEEDKDHLKTVAALLEKRKNLTSGIIT